MKSENQINVLDEISKGACMGMDAVHFILDKVEDDGLKKELENQYEKYKQIRERVEERYPKYSDTEERALYRRFCLWRQQKSPLHNSGKGQSEF